MIRDEWEAICNKCGKCCYEKVDLGGGVIRYTDEPCEHLDTETKLCKIYHDRHEVEPDCISLTEELVRTLHWMPEDCAYVQRLRFEQTLDAVRSAKKKKQQYRSVRRSQ
jgi:uncharacterized protein